MLNIRLLFQGVYICGDTYVLYLFYSFLFKALNTRIHFCNEHFLLINVIVLKQSYTLHLYKVHRKICPKLLYMVYNNLLKRLAWKKSIRFLKFL